jgi:hypothetical protein
VVRARKRICLEPWVIGLITFISLIVLAVCIGLTVHYVRYSKYELPWHHEIYSKYLLLYLPALICLKHVYSFLWFICIAGAKKSWAVLFSFNPHKARRIHSSIFDVAMLPAGNSMLVFILIS